MIKKSIILLLLIFSTSILFSCGGTTTETKDTSNITVNSETTKDIIEGDKDQINKQGGMVQGKDIINDNARYTYFYSETCMHCKNLNEYMEDNNIYDDVPLEKFELNSNSINREKFESLLAELGEETAGVPFVYDKKEKTFVTGLPDAIDMFESYKQASES